MILDYIIQFAINTLLGLINALPTIPAMPTAIKTSGDWAGQQIVSVTALLNMIFSEPLLTAVVVIVAVFYVFEPAYHLILWVLRKIPTLGIS